MFSFYHNRLLLYSCGSLKRGYDIFKQLISLNTRRHYRWISFCTTFLAKIGFLTTLHQAYDEVKFALKAMFHIRRDIATKPRGNKFSFFQPLRRNFLSLFQFVSGSRAEREVYTINGTGSLAYSRSGSKYQPR